MKTWLITVDMDHCLFHQSNELQNAYYMPNIFLRSNAQLFQSLLKKHELKA